MGFVTWVAMVCLMIEGINRLQASERSRAASRTASMEADGLQFIRPIFCIIPALTLGIRIPWCTITHENGEWDAPNDTSNTADQV